MRYIRIITISILLTAIVGCGLFYYFRKIVEPNVEKKEIKKSLNQFITNEMSVFEQSSKIDKSMTDFIHQNEINGLSLAIIKNEKLVFAKGYGLADVEKIIPVEPSNIFRLASVSKLITGVAIMKLVEDRKLSLHTKVFGKNGIINITACDSAIDKRVFDITVENLLNHSGGWTQRYGDPMFNNLIVAQILNEKPPLTIDSYIRFAVKRRLHFAPGTSSSYSNLGYVLLGEVISRVTKMPYETYVKKFILSPMGIYDMHIAHNKKEEKFVNEVTYYETSNTKPVLSINGDSTIVSKPYEGNDITLLGAAGGWVASAPELAILLTHIDGFQVVHDFLSANSVNTMIENPKATLGWKNIASDGSWVRTGTFSGTSNVLFRQLDGYEWVVLTNTSSWRGPYFSYNIMRQMKRILHSIDKWPEIDLFNANRPAQKVDETNMFAGKHKHG